MASRGVNKVILVGNLGNDPETRAFPSGDMVTNITLATSETWKDKQTGQPQEKTEWHRVVFHRRLAEIAGEYLHKGSKVYIEGSLKTRKWQGKDGQDRYTTEIVAREMQMLDSRGAGQGGGQGGGQSDYNQGGGQSNYNSGGGQPAAAQNQAPASAPAGNAPAADFGDFDDDIPF